MPKIWEDWDDFAEKMNAYANGIANAAQIAREKGRDAAMGTVIDALSCKKCHDLYREKN